MLSTPRGASHGIPVLMGTFLLRCHGKRGNGRRLVGKSNEFVIFYSIELLKKRKLILYFIDDQDTHAAVASAVDSNSQEYA